MIETGTILQKRYRVEEQIGQGGMGAVYLATDERFNSTVAIKETLLPDKNFRKAFSREARLLNGLKHSALPKVTDHFIEDNGQYIVMEYIPGDDLFEMIESKGEAFPIEDVLNWADQLLVALEYLHNQENPVIHRDIKPQNLKLTHEGKIILLDFGLAKGNPTDANHQTAANSIFGYSRLYASLEQIQGTGTDPRSDLYSLAATLYHLATGKAPADALTRVMMVLNEEEDPLLPAHLVNNQVPEYFAAVLESAMSLNAHQRPQEAFEMRQMLSNEDLTVVSVKRDTVSNATGSTNLLNQNTKIIPETNKISAAKPSEVQTELLSEEQIVNASVQTKIAESATLVGNKQVTDENAKVVLPPSQTGSNRKYVGAASVFGVLAIVGTFASMSYWGAFTPDETMNEPIPTKASKLTQPVDVPDVPKVEDTDEKLEVANTNTSVDEEATEPVEKQIEKQKLPTKLNQTTAEVTKKTKNNPKQTVTKTKVTKTMVGKDGSVIYSDGRIKAPDGTVVFRNGTIVDKNGKVLFKEGVKTGEVFGKRKKGLLYKEKYNRKNFPKGRLPIPPEQFKKLSPEQKRAVRKAMDTRRREMDRMKRQERRQENRIRRTTKPPKPPNN